MFLTTAVTLWPSASKTSSRVINKILNQNFPIPYYYFRRLFHHCLNIYESYCLQKFLNFWMCFGRTPREETWSFYLHINLIIYYTFQSYDHEFSQNSFHSSMIVLLQCLLPFFITTSCRGPLNKISGFLKPIKSVNKPNPILSRAVR